MAITVKDLVSHYAKVDSKNPQNALKRERDYLLLQREGTIPKDKPYSDTAYAEEIGVKFANLADATEANSYLTGIFNRLAKIDYKLMFGDRNDLYSLGLQSPLDSGDELEILYDQIGETTGYERDSFNPDTMNGGDLIQSQRIRLSTIIGKTNPDKRTTSIVYPALEIPQALLPSITDGLSGGFPSVFFNILKRTWEKWRFERFRGAVARLGVKPDKNEWFNPETKFTIHESSWVKLPAKTTDADSLQKNLELIYDTASDLESEYSKEHNPAGVEQIGNMKEMGIFFNNYVKAKWKTTNAVLFNGKSIDFKQVFKMVEFFKMVTPVATPADFDSVEAVMFSFVDSKHFPIIHQPFTQGIRRGIQMWEKNVGVGIFDHSWEATGINLSINVKIFYVAKTA